MTIRTETKSGDIANMVRISGDIFTMGSDSFYPEERPLREVKVNPFWIDEAPVTNREFSEFVEATGYVTAAEIPPDPKDYPGLRPDMMQAGSLVFRPTSSPVPLNDWTQWWEFCFGADWRHPQGPASSLDGLGSHPVVHVTHADAVAYATWRGKALPTEAEWECAAWGGRVDGREYQWGSELAPERQVLANYWQGIFPVKGKKGGRWETTSPIRSYPANGYLLYDMIANVWEWTSDWYAMPNAATKTSPDTCCTIANPRGGTKIDSVDPCLPDIRIPRRVIKGGSHLCAETYCQRFRPAARQGHPIDSSSSHIGFRCIIREC